jgi:hypothetical protein
MKDLLAALVVSIISLVEWAAETEGITPMRRLQPSLSEQVKDLFDLLCWNVRM